MGWDSFRNETLESYGVDMACLKDSFARESEEYYLKTSVWEDASPAQMLVPLDESCEIAAYDLNTVSIDEVRSVDARFEFAVGGGGACAQHHRFPDGDEDMAGDAMADVPPQAEERKDPCANGEEDVSDPRDSIAMTMSGFLGWFDVSFEGSREHPVPEADVVTLTTEPCEQGATHWGQQGFLLQPQLEVRPGDRISGRIQCRRRADNHRLLNVGIDFSHASTVNGIKYNSETVHAVFQMD